MEDTSWVNNAIRTFFSMIDGAVYSAIAIVYRILLYLSDYQLFTNETLYAFSQRVYSLLALVMIFKISFSLINYVVNPDAFLDKEKGVSKLIQNILISLAMLIAAPFCFSLLRDLQSAIIDDQIIPKFFLKQKGQNADMIVEENKFYISDMCSKLETGDPGMATADSTEDLIAIMMFKPFFQPYDPFDDNINVELEVPEFYCTAYLSSDVRTYLQPSIYNAYYDVKDTNDEDNRVYMIDYKVFLSSVTGIVGLLVLISFCFDVAVRVIKLAFLQIIAPIPIISYIDPSSSKNGMFKKWLQQVGTTWLSVFVRLAAFFFALYVIQLVATNDFGEFEDDKTWVILFLILGALMFAKQLPSLLSELMPGLKLDGKVQLNPFKRIENDAVGGKAIIGAAKGAAAAGVAAAGALAGHQLYLSQQRQNISKNKAERAQIEKDFDLDGKRQQLLRSRMASQRLANRYQSLSESATGATKQKYERLRDLYQGKAEQADKEYERQKELLATLTAKNDEAIRNIKNNRLYKHPILSTLGTTAKGAYFGARDGYKAGGLIGTAKAGLSGMEKAGKERNDREKRGLTTDFQDKFTDLMGIKNESGTTSLANKEIKRLNDSLTRYTTEQQRLSQQMAVLGQAYSTNQAEYNKIVGLSSEGKYAAFGRELGQAFSEYARQGGTLNQSDFNNIYSNVISLAEVEDQIADIKKAIKEQESVKKKV